MSKSNSISWELIPEKNYVIISPYLIPLNSQKKVNIGDGFIMDSAVKLIGAKPKAVFSSRVELSDKQIAIINDSQLILVAGANTLKDNFEITPNFDSILLKKIKIPIALCGLGHFGNIEQTKNGLNSKSIEVVTEILKRFPYISVRCDESRRYLTRSLTDKAESILMTSCPVVYSVDDMNKKFSSQVNFNHLVVTITDRAYIEKQIKILEVGPKLFPSRRITLALHQDYGNAPLWSLAKKLGYEIFRSDSYEDFIDLYRDADMHFGNRLHAHLKCISLGVRTFLTPFDLRQSFFAESLDFPLVSKIPNPDLQTYDFNRLLLKRNSAEVNMVKFLDSVRSLIN